MIRRTFLSGGAASLVVTGLPGVALAGAGADFSFVDERFARSRRLAGAAFGRTTPMAVRGDVTAVWRETVEPLIDHRPLAIHGVTTEPFVFCLDLLTRERAATDLRIERLDRELLGWVLRTRPGSSRRSAS